MKKSPIDTVRLLTGYDANAHSDGYFFDEEKAADAIWWIQDNCHHVKGPLGGQLLVLEEWQQAFVGTLFGWFSEADGSRRYNEVFAYVPRKNGKTPLVAAIGLYVMHELRDPGFEGYSAAGGRNQATLLFTWMSGMIRANPDLADHYKIYNAERTIVPLEDLAAAHRVIPADADMQHGGNISMVLFDELHVQRDRELYDVLKTGTAARENPLFISLTTADTLREGSICNDRLAKGLAVITGTIADPRFLPIVFRAEPSDPWDDIETWKKANPNYGVSLKESYVLDTIQACKDTPRLIPAMLRFHLNIQTGALDIWLNMADWYACADLDTPADAPGPALRGFANGRPQGPCYAGLDLASTDDFTALVLFWPETFDVLCRFYLPEDTAALPTRKDYAPWIEAGWVTITEGNVTDYHVVRQDIVDLHAQHNIQALGYDVRNANEITTHLYNDDGVNCVPVAQNIATLSEPSKKIEVAVRQRKLRHHNNPVLAWMAGNAAVKTDENTNILPSKKRSAGKIDGITALITAQAVQMTETAPSNIDDAIVFI